MKQRLLIPALVVLGILAISAGAYAASGGGSSFRGVLSLEATTTGTPEATATGTPEATTTTTPEATPTGTVEAAATETPAATPEATATAESGPGNHEGGILGIPSEDSPACENHDGCTIKTTPSGNEIRVPNTPGHGKNGNGNGNGNNGNGNGNGGGD